MSGLDPGHAQLAQKHGDHGYYVVNPVSGLAVEGPYLDHPSAQRAAARLNARPPVAPDRLEVRLLGPSGSDDPA
jgi:hypothetical protein